MSHMHQPMPITELVSNHQPACSHSWISDLRRPLAPRPLPHTAVCLVLALGHNALIAQAQVSGGCWDAGHAAGLVRLLTEADTSVSMVLCVGADDLMCALQVSKSEVSFMS